MGSLSYVTYKANVQVGSGVGDVSWDNTADFSAGSVKKVSSQDGTVKKTQTTEGGITLGKTYIKIYKGDRENTDPLAGVTFALERYNETSQAWDKMQEVTTGADGYAYFGQTPEITTADPALQLDSGVKYRFQETKVPDGYLLNSEYYYFQIAGEKEFEDPQYPVKQRSSATAAFSILNTAKISVSATKSWNDANNQDGKRPDEIVVTLKANWQDANVTTEPTLVNGEVVNGKNNQVKLKADASGSWANTKVTWNDLPKVDSNGQQITYTVEESWFSKEYSASYQYPDKNVWGVKGQDGNVVITNTHTPEKTSVKFKKIWDDNSDQDGLREKFGELYVALFADGTLVEKDADGNAVAPKQINKKSNTSEYSWDNLPKYKSGKEITYTIKEGTLTNGVFQEFTKESLENLGYTSKTDTAKTPIELTNTHEPKTESLKVIKTWAGKDATKDDGNRPDSVTVKLQKSTDGKKWKDVANSAGVQTTVTLNENNSWSYTWSKLPSYESGKKLSYQVVETVPSHYEVTYGKSVDNNGVSTITVTNTYKPTTINVEATKYWNDQDNKDGKRPEKIQFQLQKMEGTDGKWVNVGDPQTLTGTTNIWGTAKWTDLLTYENGKKISYRVVEVENEEIKNNYSTNSQKVPENGGTVTITNTRATSTKFQPVIYKDLTGNRKLTEDGKKFSSGEFEFVLKDKDVKELQKKGVDADGKVTFDEIPYEKEGTYTYTISEVIPDDRNKVPGVEYSTAIVTMTVKVAPNKAGTKLEATASYTFSGNGAELKNGNVTFTNVYTAHGQASVTGKKNVKNITGNVPSFNFALYDANGKIVTYKDADGNTKECTASNDSEGNFTIQTPYYTQDDVKDSPYTYYLREVLPSGATKANDYKSGNYTYDPASYTVKVTVTDNGNGTLNVVPTVENAATVEFVNTYNAEGGLAISVQKEVVSSTDTTKKLDIPTDKSFEFVLYKGEKSTDRNTKVESIYSPSSGSVSSFKNISYTAADIGNTFYYQVREKKDLTKTWYMYSEDYYDIDVTVKDGGEGKLSIIKTIYKNGKKTQEVTDDTPLTFVFTNKYKAAGSITLKATKTLSGKKLKNEQFTFELYAKGSNTLLGTATNKDGEVTFETLNFNESQLGTHEYVIREVQNKNSTSTMDGRSYGYVYAKDINVTVTVSEGEAGANGRNGTLTVKAFYDGKESCTLENKYTAKGNTTLTVDKKLEGRTLNDTNTKDFTFVLTPADNETPAASQATATVDKETGKATFNLEYTEKDAGKQYTYILSERDDQKDGYEYSNATYRVEVSIADTKDNGELDVTMTVKDAEGNPLGEDENPSYTNFYEAKGSLALTAKKNVIGKDATGETFTFALLDENSTYETDENGKILSVTNQKAQETVTVTGTTGTVTFPEITYVKDKEKDETGIHVYRVVELKGSDTGYDYSSTVYTVTVKVSDPGTGTLNVEKTISGGQEIIFNNDYSASGSTVLKARKELKGRDLEDQQFAFILKDNSGTEIDRVKNSGEEVVLGAGKLTYTHKNIGKTYRYTMEEVSDATQKAYQFSQTVYTALVTIKDGKNGSVTPEIRYYRGNISADEAKTATELEPEKVVFENVYTANGSITLNGIKYLDHKNLKDDQFTFQLLDENQELIKETTNKDGKFSFELAYDQDSLAVKDADGNIVGHVAVKDGKDFVYYVKEKEGDASYYNYCDWMYRVTVHVKDNGDGKLLVTKNVELVASDTDSSRADTDKLTFINKYTPSGSLTLPVEKVLTGRSLSDETTPEFSFVLQGDGQYQKIVNDKDGKGSFEISYNEKDINQTYLYTVSEVNDRKDGYIYDETIYQVEVHVSDDGEGTLIPEVTIHKKGEESLYKGALTFTNKYEATGSLTLEGTKVLNGRKLEAEQFTFALSEGREVLQTARNAEDGSFKFDPIEYTTANIGIHTYKVQEVTPAADGSGYNYDRTIYTVVVEVSDNGDGTLNVDVRKENDKEPELKFTNTYKAEGKTSVTATKVLTGTNLKENQFSFTLESTGIAPAYKETVKNALNGTISFPEMNYTEADAGQTYTYLMYEEIPAEKAKGYTYDETVYHVEVTITDNGDGHLTTATKIYEVSGPAGRPVKTEVEKAQFTNAYHAKETLNLTAQKNLTGRLLADGQFAFILKSKEVKEGETAISQRKTNDLNGQITFDPISYTEQDLGKTYTYLLYEEIPAEKAECYTYDETEYEITVTPKDNGDGTLTVTPEIKKLGMTDAETTVVEKAEFNNHYNADGELTLTATKLLTGRTIEDGQFTFTLTGPKTEDQSKSNVGTQVTFDLLKYDESDAGKDYVYTIREEIPTDKQPGYTYDESIYEVTVSVRDQGNGKLNAAVSDITKITTENEEKKTEKADAVAFVNTYKATGETSISAEKILKGRTIADKQFSFTLKGDPANEANGDTNKDQTVKNVGKNVTFANLTYTEKNAGKTYTYYLQEVVPDMEVPGYGFDNTVHTVEVTVTDNGDGTLKVEKTIDGKTVEASKDDETKTPDAVFTNTYSAKGDIVLTASKAYAEGVQKSLLANEYQFAVLENGNEVATGTNALDGKITFSEISYKLTPDDTSVLGEHTYTVKETRGTDGAVLYDETEYTVKVKVSDDGSGILKAEVVGDTKEADLKFVNDLTKVKVSKIDVTNNTELPGAKLEIRDADGKVIDSWISGSEPHYIEGILKAGQKYTLTETAVPDGYKYAEEITFEVGKDGKVQTVTMKDAPSKLTVSKKDMADLTKNLPGATFEVQDENGDVVRTVYNETLRWTTTADALVKTIIGLKDGSYQLVETKAPTGYTIADSISFTVEKGKIYRSVDGEQAEIDTIAMEDQATEVIISKTDITTGKELPGATLQILKKVKAATDAGEEVEKEETVITIYGEKLEWVSGETPKTIKGLPAGEYILRETAAPNGYTIAKDVKFTVTDELKAAETVVMENAPIEVNISKNDITTEKELPGATLQVLKKVTGEDGTETEEVVTTIYGEKLEWKSTGEPKNIKGLPAGEYILRESAAPDGYTVAADVTFTVTDELKAVETVEMQDAPIETVISKVDMADTAKELPGATLQILKKVTAEDGTTSEEIAVTVYGEKLRWISGEEAKEIKGLPAGDYILREIAAPTGYTIAKDVEFTVSNDRKVTNKAVMEDQATEVKISKVDITDAEKELPGATLQVMDKYGNEIVKTVYGEELKWVSGNEAKVIKGLSAGEYTLRETIAPAGYSIAKDVKFTITDELKAAETVTMKDAAIEAVISKVDITNAEKELPGAELQIMDTEGKEVVKTIFGEELKWTSAETAKQIKGLPAGEYILRETKAPTGFAVAADVKFTISDDLTVENKVVMKDAPTDVTVSKVALTNETRELPGATLQILDEKGEIAKTVYGEQLSWISDVTAKVIKGLPAGTYTLRETAAPDGYALAEDVAFTVNTDGTTTKVVMKDDVTRVQISKMDVTNNKELAGAHLALKDASGEIILNWISTGEPKVFEGKLIAGATYTLTEISAPSGYSLAKDITFTVNSNNEIQKIVMDDKVASGDASVIVQKLVKYKDQYKTIDDYTFYTALFADEACTQRVSSVKALRVQQSYTTSTIFTNLEYGTYYVAETDEFGNPISESFVIDSNEILDGKVSLTPKSQMGKSMIINYVNGNLPENPYNDGKITVNKQVLIGSEPGNVTDTFYFALFTDAAHTIMASADIQKLELNDESSGTVVFDRLPYGEYYLAETDEDGVPVDSDFGYTVTLDASYCKISSDSTAVERTITNSKAKEPDTEPVTQPTTSTTNRTTTTKTTTTTTTPKTGDDTNIAFYLTLMMMAALVGTGYGVRRRKKKEQR